MTLVAMKTKTTSPSKEEAMYRNLDDYLKDEEIEGHAYQIETHEKEMSRFEDLTSAAEEALNLLRTGNLSKASRMLEESIKEYGYNG